MANIDRLVDVQISLNTTGIATSSFSDAIFVVPHHLNLSRMMAITGADQLLEMGAQPTDAVYRAAQAWFSQGRHPSKLYIGRKQINSVKLAVNKAKAAEYKITVARKVGGETVTQTASTTGTAEMQVNAIATALKTAAASIGVTVSVSNNVLTISSDDAFTLKYSNLDKTEESSTESWTDALAAIRKAGGDWYGLVISSRKAADVLEVAAWAESNHKMFGTASSDEQITDGSTDTDILSQLKTKGYAYTFGMYHTKAETEFPELALMADRFTYYPGQETWANVKLNGITADNLLESHAIVVHQKNGTTFENFGSFSISQQSKTASGEWVDVIRFRDWLKATMQADIAYALINAGGKVPYTDKGIQIIVNAMRKSLDLGVQRGGIAEREVDSDNQVLESYTINYPKSADISPNTKAKRILQDVGGVARLAGAIHLVEIKFALAYTL